MDRWVLNGSGRNIPTLVLATLMICYHTCTWLWASECALYLWGYLVLDRTAVAGMLMSRARLFLSILRVLEITSGALS